MIIDTLRGELSTKALAALSPRQIRSAAASLKNPEATMVGGDVQLLALRHQAVARQRVGVLPAHQCADTADRRVNHTQAAAVAVAPGQLLPEGGHQFAVAIQDAAVVADEQVGIPDAADADFGGLVDADRHHHTVLASGSAHPVDGRMVDGHGALGHAHEELVVLDRCAHAGPDRESADVGFRKGHDLGAMGRRFGDQRASLVDGGVKIEVDGRHMAGRRLESIR
jgi:hypothetical protein